MNTNKVYIFVADWCPFCREAKQAIFQLVEKFADNGNIILLEDSSAEFREIAPKFNVGGFPTFLSVDENDKVLATYDGPRDYKSLETFYTNQTGVIAE